MHQFELYPCPLKNFFSWTKRKEDGKSSSLKWTKVWEESRGIGGNGEEGLGLDKDTSGWLWMCVRECVCMSKSSVACPQSVWL